MWDLSLQGNSGMHASIHSCCTFLLVLETDPIDSRSRRYGSPFFWVVPNKSLARIIPDSDIRSLSTLAKLDEANICSYDCRFDFSVSIRLNSLHIRY